MRRALLALLLLGAAPAPRSGYEDASPAVRAMQDDDTSNPAMLAVADGQAAWDTRCASCHGDVSTLRGAATRYPAYDPALRRPVLLEQRVAHAGPLPSADLLALTALVGLQSRGMPLAVDAAGSAAPFVQQGEALFRTRMGQLNLSCAHCHDGLAGQRLGGARIPEGHPNGYPLYRLEWQSVGTLYRRLRNCMAGVRAEPFAADSAERVALELYLAVRATGLPVETPAVRP